MTAAAGPLLSSLVAAVIQTHWGDLFIPSLTRVASAKKQAMAWACPRHGLCCFRRLQRIEERDDLLFLCRRELVEASLHLGGFALVAFDGVGEA